MTQPGLGRVANVFGYPASYIASAVIIAVAVPFVALAQRENAVSDPLAVAPAEPSAASVS